jgi:hypothetical protein
MCLIYAAGCQEAAKQTNLNPVGQSALYEQFDQNKLREKYTPNFSVARKVTSDSGFTAKATGDLFKSVVIQGDISDEQFQKVFESVQTELLNLARSSSVTITGEPNSDIKGRPDWLFKMFFDDAKPDTLRGSYFTYSHGPIEGAVEILTQAPGGKNEAGWNLTVVLHEKRYTEAGK